MVTNASEALLQAEHLKALLVAEARGERGDDAEYKALRRALLADPSIIQYIPSFLGNCRTLREFWYFIQPKFAHYREREQYLADEFTSLLGYLEEQMAPQTIHPRGMNLDSRFRVDFNAAIGEGGFADVYQAIDVIAGPDSPNRKVAVKLLRAIDDDESRARFERELRLIQKLDHSNIVPVITHGISNDGRLWYAMPQAVTTLDDTMPMFVADDAKIASTMEQICAGVAYIHEQGVIHRDLKPSNILLTQDSMWAISDFGLAREEQRRTAGLTSTKRTGLGTFLYVAPEQWSSPKTSTISADIYALGRILWALTIGGDPSPGLELPHSIFRPVIQKATRSRPEDRYQSVAELMIDIHRVLGSASSTNYTSKLEGLVRCLQSDSPSDSDLTDFIAIACGPDKHLLFQDGNGHLSPLRGEEATMAPQVIERLQQLDPSGLKAFFDSYCRFIRSVSLPFARCDPIATFCQRVCHVSPDDDMFRWAITALTELGFRHNRWAVKTAVQEMLRTADTSNRALVALHGLQEARTEAVDWITKGIALSLLHPVLSQGLAPP